MNCDQQFQSLEVMSMLHVVIYRVFNHKLDVEMPANVAAWWLCKQVTLNVHHASEVRYSVKRFPQNVNCLSCAV